MSYAEDNDWGYGSYDKDEAMEMVQQYIPDGGYIAVIDESGDEPMCVREIRDIGEDQ